MKKIHKNIKVKLGLIRNKLIKMLIGILQRNQIQKILLNNQILKILSKEKLLINKLHINGLKIIKRNKEKRNY